MGNLKNSNTQPKRTPFKNTANQFIMPCNRRNLNAHAFSFHADMFPAESLLAAFLEQASSSRAGEELHPVSSRGDSHPNKEVHNEESSQAHIVRMDVPGVKANRVTIEEQNGEVEITAVRD